MDIPKEVREQHNAVCTKCDIRKWYARRLDMHFDWVDCPYDCENDLEHIGLVKCGECLYATHDPDDNEDIYYCPFDKGHCFHSGDKCTHEEARTSAE